MLIIEFFKTVARWNNEICLFEGSHPLATELLNLELDQSALNKVDAPYCEGGVEGLALRQVQAAYEDSVKVLVFRPIPPPPEEPGVDV